MKTAKLNVANRTLFIRDNIIILDNLNDECVDLIYLDPPFNSNRHYSAPVGSKAAGAEFSDMWHLDDVDNAWLDVIKELNAPLAVFLESVKGFGGKGDASYLIYMARRLIEMKRILKESGSIYLHCDPTMSHSLKIVMDCIFLKKNFRNEIIWHYGKWSNAAKYFQRNHDVILFYSKSANYVFNTQYQGFSEKTTIAKYARKVDARGISVQDKDKPLSVDEKRKRGVAMHDTWDLPFLHPMSKERKGYPTQKPLALLERIIKAGSNEGDIVLDPFCGCATALVAAEMLGRQWVGVDISPKSEKLVKERLEESQDIYTTIKEKKGEGSAWKKVSVLHNYVERTDVKGDIVIPQKYKATLYGIQEGGCKGCKNHFLMQNLEIDHVHPVSKGGGNTKKNLQLLCGHCNRKKGTKSQAEFMAIMKRGA